MSDISNLTKAIGPAMTDITNVTKAIGPAFALFREVYAWRLDRDRRKKQEAQQIEAALTPEDRRARTEGRLRDVLMVLNVLGEQLFSLGLVEVKWLPFALGQVLKTFRTRDDAFRAMFEEQLEQSSQYAVTAAMFLCAECWPMHIYHGFGACVTNEWSWGHPKLDNAEIASMDRCIALLKAGPGREVLKRYPVGLSRMTPRLEKKLKDHLLLYDEKFLFLQGKGDLCKKKGPPQPKDKSFAVTEMIWPWSTYDSEFSLQNKFTSDLAKLAQLLEWQQDPGRMVYAFTIGGFLDLRMGQLLDPLDNEITMSILWWLFGLNGTTFKLMWQAELDITHWELPPTSKKLQWWNQNSSKVVYAVLDESRSKQRCTSMLPQTMTTLSPPLAQSESPFFTQPPFTGAAVTSGIQHIPPPATSQPMSTPTTATAWSVQSITSDLVGLEFSSIPVSANASSPSPLLSPAQTQPAPLAAQQPPQTSSSKDSSTASEAVPDLISFDIPEPFPASEMISVPSSPAPTPSHPAPSTISTSPCFVGQLPAQTQLPYLSPEAPVTSFPPPPTMQAAPPHLSPNETLPNAVVRPHPAAYQPTQAQLEAFPFPQAMGSLSPPQDLPSLPTASPDHLFPATINLVARPHTTSPGPSATTGMFFPPPPTVTPAPAASKHSSLLSWAKDHLGPIKAPAPVEAVPTSPSPAATTTLFGVSSLGPYQSAGSSAMPLSSVHAPELVPSPSPSPNHFQSTANIANSYQAPALTPFASPGLMLPQSATYIPTPAPQHPTSHALATGLSPMFKAPSITQNQSAPEAIYRPVIGAYPSATAPAVPSPPVYNPSTPAPPSPMPMAAAPASVVAPSVGNAATPVYSAAAGVWSP